MAGVLDVHVDMHRQVTINGTRYSVGSASGEGCNCLINTLNQLLRTGVSSRFVRTDLRREFTSGPDSVTEGNFLDLRAHWEAIVRSLGRHSTVHQGGIEPSSLKFICADLVYVGQGDIVGSGPVTYHLARVHTNHFVPLIRVWGRA